MQNTTTLKRIFPIPELDALVADEGSHVDLTRWQARLLRRNLRMVANPEQQLRTMLLGDIINGQHDALNLLLSLEASTDEHLAALQAEGVRSAGEGDTSESILSRMLDHFIAWRKAEQEGRVATRFVTDEAIEGIDRMAAELQQSAARPG